MSHNASALTSVFDMSAYTPVTRQTYNTTDCLINSTALNNVSQCGVAGSGNFQLNRIFTHNQLSFLKGDIVEFDLISNTAAYGAVGSGVTAFGYQAFKPLNPDVFYLYGLEQVSTESFINQFGSNSYYGNINSVLHVTLYVAKDYTSQVGFYATDTTYNPVAYWSQSASTTKLEWNIINLVKWRKTEKSSVNQEQEEATQNAANDSQTSGNSSQSSAEGATQSLLTTINSGIGVITSARATNCQINGNMGNLDLGNLDLCANTVPTFVQIILSLVAVVTVIPLAIVLFNRFIGIFRSFQG